MNRQGRRRQQRQQQNWKRQDRRQVLPGGEWELDTTEVTIHWGDGEVSTVPLWEVGLATGLGPAETRAAIDGLDSSGWFTPRTDGSYDATIPHGTPGGDDAP